MTDESGRWDWDHISALVPDGVLNHMVVVIPPCPNEGFDQIAWKWLVNGLFFFAANYKNLINHSSSSSSIIWKLIWKSKAPQRVRVFLWLLWQEKILTNGERVQRHMSDEGHCVL